MEGKFPSLKVKWSLEILKKRAGLPVIILLPLDNTRPSCFFQWLWMWIIYKFITRKNSQGMIVSPELKLENSQVDRVTLKKQLMQYSVKPLFIWECLKWKENWSRYEILSNSILCKFMYETKSSIAMKSSGL